MQFINDIRQKGMVLLEENATTLLTAAGVVGTVATAVLTGRAAFQAAKKLQEHEYEVIAEVESPEEANLELTKQKKFLIAAPYFIPPVVTGSATIASIIMANRISAQKAAALAAAYGLAERNLSEYKDKVAEKLTGPKKTAIDDELAQDRVNRTGGHESIVVVEGEVLCFDEPTGRYFRSTMERMQRAVNTVNAEILHHDHASASFFYEELELPATTWTEEVGWNTDQLLELKYSTVLSPDGRPCIAIDFKVLPKIDYIPKHY